MDEPGFPGYAPGKPHAKMLPNYLVIGAAKCGTSSLCHLLGSHPDAFMSRPKEIHFFGRNDPTRTLEWYQAFFDAAGSKRAVGEGSTSYTHPEIMEAAAEQIHRLIPLCRLIYMVRRPIERLESDWKMRRHDGWPVGTINEAVRNHASLITLGLYWRNLSVYRRHFPDQQIRIVFLEDFTRDPDTELRRCFEHIGVDPDMRIADANRARNAASGYRNYGAVARRLRSAAWFTSVKRFIPRWSMNAAKAVLSRKASLVPEWDPAVRSLALESFTEDSKRLLEFCGKPAEFWAERPPGSSVPAGGGPEIPGAQPPA